MMQLAEPQEQALVVAPVWCKAKEFSKKKSLPEEKLYKQLIEQMDH